MPKTKLTKTETTKKAKAFVIYLVGSISNNAGAFEQFEYWENEIGKSKKAFTILNPMHICRQSGAIDDAERMRVCMEILSERMIDFVVLLPKWETSEGATLEEQYCRARGLTVVNISDFMKLTQLL